MSKAPIALLVALGACGLAQAATFSGTVFEDVNYGGGAGRPNGTAGTVPIGGVRVELYNATSGAFVAATNTATTPAAAIGTYSLSSGNTGAAMIIRVVNGTVRSSRAGGASTATVAVQTFRTAGAGTNNNNVNPVTNRVGGENPAVSDGPSNTGNFSAIDDNGGVAQSVTTSDPSGNNSAVTGIDFGFNFSTVVNTRDPAACGATNSSYPCQGSLRQFLTNATTLGGKNLLAQAGQGLIDNSATALPGGNESSIFMIPTAQLSGGVAVITLSGALPAVSVNNIRLDATTQTVNVGNTNNGQTGSGGTVGVDAISLPFFQLPEVQLTSGNNVVTLSGNSTAILGFALQQGYILLSGTGCLAQDNLVGMTASGSSAANSTTTYGITFTGTNSTVRHNFVTVNNSGIRTDNAGTGSLVTLNEVARPTAGHNNTFDGILLVGTVSSIQVLANLTRDQQGGGIELGHGNGATASNILVQNNTVRGNGFTTVGGTTASTEPVGMSAYSYVGSGVVFRRNISRDNAGPGMTIISGSGTQITQNSFSSNGGLAIDLDPRGNDPNNLGGLQGVTLNDNTDGDAGPNGLLNYPVIAYANLVSGELSFSGFARPGSSIELYVAQSPADSSGFGEGLTYLGTLVEGSAADLDTTTGTYGPAAINGVLQGTDTTNRFAFRVAAPPGVVLGTRLTSTATIGGQTSEFGGNVTVTAGPLLQVTKESSTLTDPVNTTNPKSIPGAVKLYTITVTNQGTGAVDNNSVLIVDNIPANTRMYVGDLGTPAGPVAFVNGTPSSALTWTYGGLNNLTDDLDFSNDGGATWNYVPVPDVAGFDAAVNAIRLRPKGVMPGQGVPGSPNFQLQFRVSVN